jgi:hypothetical protein
MQNVPVEVRTSLGLWADGFEVVEQTPVGCYRLRRMSDGAVLPTEFSPKDVREVSPAE